MSVTASLMYFQNKYAEKKICYGEVKETAEPISICNFWKGVLLLCF